MKTQKTHSLEELKVNAMLSLTNRPENTQNKKYVIAWVQNLDLNPRKVYDLAISLASTIRFCTPSDFAKSAKFAAVLRRDYGQEVFNDFLKEIEAKG
jgi:hypothetical protein